MRIASLVCHAVVRDPAGSGLKNSFGEKDYDIKLTSGRLFEVKGKSHQLTICIPMENVPYFIPSAEQEAAATNKSKQ